LAIAARITSKGQITIPREVRERLGLRTGDQVEFVEGPEGFIFHKCIDESAFDRWQGYLKAYAGRTSDELMEEMRGE